MRLGFTVQEVVSALKVSVYIILTSYWPRTNGPLVDRITSIVAMRSWIGANAGLKKLFIIYIGTNSGVFWYCLGSIKYFLQIWLPLMFFHSDVELGMSFAFLPRYNSEYHDMSLFAIVFPFVILFWWGRYLIVFWQCQRIYKPVLLTTKELKAFCIHLLTAVHTVQSRAGQIFNCCHTVPLSFF